MDLQRKKKRKDLGKHRREEINNFKNRNGAFITVLHLNRRWKDFERTEELMFTQEFRSLVAGLSNELISKRSMIANKTTLHKRPSDTEIYNYGSPFGLQQ